MRRCLLQKPGAGRVRGLGATRGTHVSLSNGPQYATTEQCVTADAPAPVPKRRSVTA